LVLEQDVILASNQVPIANIGGEIALSGVNLIGVSRFTRRQHLDGKCSRSSIAEVNTLLAPFRGQEKDRKAPIGILLADDPSAVPVLVLDEMRDPIHGSSIARTVAANNDAPPRTSPIECGFIGFSFVHGEVAVGREGKARPTPYFVTPITQNARGAA